MREIDGLPVVDAKHPITIHVNKGDLNKANTKDPADCVVARACRRELHAKEVRVHLGRVYVRTNDNNWVRFVTPPRLRNEIISFDRSGKFETGDFLLWKPGAGRPAGKRYGGDKGKRGNGKKRRPYHFVKDVRARA